MAKIKTTVLLMICGIMIYACSMVTLASEVDSGEVITSEEGFVEDAMLGGQGATAEPPTVGGEGASLERPVHPPIDLSVEYEEEIESEEVVETIPLTEESIVEIVDEEVPLAASIVANEWSLLNLILVIGTTTLSAILLIECAIGGRMKKTIVFLRVLGVIPAVVAISIFTTTQNMLNAMIMVDEKTLLMMAIAFTEIVIAFVVRRNAVEGQEKEILV